MAHVAVQSQPRSVLSGSLKLDYLKSIIPITPEYPSRGLGFCCDGFLIKGRVRLCCAPLSQRHASVLVGSVRLHRSSSADGILAMSNSNGHSLERGIWAAVIIAALIVVLRVFAKIKIKRFYVDDVLMIIAQVRSILLEARCITPRADSL